MRNFTIMIVGTNDDFKLYPLSQFDTPGLRGIQLARPMIDYSDLSEATGRMTKVDFVVTLDNWHDDKLLKQLVMIAQALQIPVISHVRYKDHVQQINA